MICPRSAVAYNNVRKNTLAIERRSGLPPSGPKNTTVGWVMRTVPRRNSVSHAVTAEMMRATTAIARLIASSTMSAFPVELASQCLAGLRNGQAVMSGVYTKQNLPNTLKRQANIRSNESVDVLLDRARVGLNSIMKVFLKPIGITVVVHHLLSLRPV